MIRTYHSQDTRALLAAWNQSLPADSITDDIFLRHIATDANFDPHGLFIAEDHGRIIGALLAIVRRMPLSGTDLEPDTGWITTFFVHPTSRHRGIGQALLRAADDFFIRRHRTTIFFASYAPGYFLPGIDRRTYPAGANLLESAGFSMQYEAVAMDKNLVGWIVPGDVRAIEERHRQNGMLIEALTLPYVSALLSFIDSEFNPDWSRAVRSALQHGLPLSRILIARSQDALAGF
ncbi:MAG: GNAT family N-acetyltransferase, partial [Firmicutes bacterium]|nr:GNAT family N-acetyltransferase [Bacillota bacterium]